MKQTAREVTLVVLLSCRSAGFPWGTLSEQQLEEESETTMTGQTLITAPSRSPKNNNEEEEEIEEPPPSYRSLFSGNDNITTLAVEKASSGKVEGSSPSSTGARKNAPNSGPETLSLASPHDNYAGHKGNPPPPHPPRPRPPPPPYSAADAEKFHSVSQGRNTGQTLITTTEEVEENVRLERHGNATGTSRSMWLSTVAVDSLAKFSRFLALLVTSKLLVAPMTEREEIAVVELIRAR